MCEMPVSPEKMKPMMHVDMADIKNVGDLEVGDEITLTVKATVKGMMESHEESGPMNVDLEIGDITMADRG